MSTSALYRVSKTTATELHEYRNGWGSGPVIWDLLEEKHLKRGGRGFGDDKQLWALAQDERVPLAWRLVHAFCFDGAVVTPAGLNELADACREVYEETQPLWPDRVNHWLKIGEDLRALAGVKIGRSLGYGLTCTSVSDIWADYCWSKGKTYKPFDCVAYAKKTRGTEAA